jgi:hypothetical protein
LSIDKEPQFSFEAANSLGMLGFFVSGQSRNSKYEVSTVTNLSSSPPHRFAKKKIPSSLEPCSSASPTT